MSSIPEVTMQASRIIRDDQATSLARVVREIALRHANLETVEAGVEACASRHYLKVRHNSYNRRR